jgi:hypothetical protein
VNVVQAGETGPTLSDNRVPYHGSNDHASNGIEYPAVSRTASSTANDYYTFLTHSLPHSMFEKLGETSAKISQFGRSSQTQ